MLKDLQPVNWFFGMSQVIWAPKWSKRQIERGRAQETKARERYYADAQNPMDTVETPIASPPVKPKAKKSLSHKVTK
jgi:hypothetical protein